MKRIRFITRADDAGSSRSANLSIAKCINAGFIKNVSVMAPGAHVAQAAALFGQSKKVCFGMHITLNAEWDQMKWGPVSTLPPDSGLTDSQGMFLADPKQFAETKPAIDVILNELDAQLDKLTRAGFTIRYADSHMLPELYVPGLNDAVGEWIHKKGLLDHMLYYNLPPDWKKIGENPGSLLSVLRSTPSGQYFFIAHPALYSNEMLQTGNAQYSGEIVAQARNKEAKLFGNPALKWLMKLIHIRPIRYDEAIPGKRLTPEALLQILGS